MTSRLPAQREHLRIGDAMSKFGLWTVQRYLTSESFYRSSDLSAAFDFSETEGVQEIIKIFADVGLQIFETVQCEGKNKLVIKPGMAQKLKQNLKGYVSKGIWSTHNYSVVSIKEVKVKSGRAQRLVKLRNCWQGEVYTGECANFNDASDPSDFYMDIVEFMQIFQCMNVYKVNPNYVQQNISVEFPNKELVATVIRISVKQKGKYTFSVDQKDLHMHRENEKYRHNRVKVTLGILEKNQFQILSHTSSNKLRNTYIRKVIDKGEYFLMIEVDTRG